MAKLVYVEGSEDKVIPLKDEDAQIDNIVHLTRSLFDRGIKFVALETNDIRIFFDAKEHGMKAISGKFKY